MASLQAFNWVHDLQEIITDYDEGTKTNPSNNNMYAIGQPGTGKNQTLSIAKEMGLVSDNIKLIEAHASDPEHLEELLRFAVDNNKFDRLKAEEKLNLVMKNLRNDEYSHHELEISDIKPVVKDLKNVSKSLESVKDLISRAENDSLQIHLSEAKDRLEVMEKKINRGRQFVSSSGFPNQLKRAYSSYDGFNVKVLTPISSEDRTGSDVSGMPSDVEVPDFFEPFGIPVEDFTKYGGLKYSLRMVFRDHNFKNYRDLYKNIVDIGDTSFADLKNADVTTGKDYIQEIDFGETTVQQTKPDMEEQGLKQFKRYWYQMFGNEGVVCSSDFDYKLRPQLKEFLLDDDVDVIILYTGFLRDEGVRDFVLTYFCETYRSIIRNLSPEETNKLNRKFWLSFLECQEILPDTSGRGTDVSTTQKIFIKFFREFANNPRHMKTDIILDGKPNDIHPMALDKSQHGIITQLSDKQWERMKNRFNKKLRKRVESAQDDKEYQNLDFMETFGYGFVWMSGRTIDDKCPAEWVNSKGRKTYGCRLPVNRRTSEVDPSLNHSDWSVFTETLGFDSMTFKKFQDALAEDWEEHERPYRERKDKQREKRKKAQQQEEKSEKQKRKQFAIQTLKGFFSDARNKIPDRSDPEAPDAWSYYLYNENNEKRRIETVKEQLVEHFEIEDIDKRTIEQYTEEVRGDLEDQKKSVDSEDLDVSDVQEAIYRNEEYAKDFALFSGGKNDKAGVVADFLKEQRGIQLSRDDEFVTRVRDKLKRRYVKEGVIGTQNNIKLDGEDMEDYIENFEELMGFNG